MNLTDLKPYRAMKDSGVEWLGEVPTHWDECRLKTWLAMNQLVLSEETDPDYAFNYLDIGCVGTGHLVASPERVQFKSAPSRARRVVRLEDTVISTVRTYLKAVWYADVPNPNLIASTGFAVLTPRPGTCPKFVSYLCQSAAFTDRVTAESVGVAYPAIAEKRLASFHVIVPPLPEQTAIARFLDHATSRIDRYIRAKEKMLALLEEQKQAIIQEAVTGRIDVRTGRPYLAYKPSGIEWLGEVPSHWDVRRAKRVFCPRNEYARPDDKQLSATQAYGVIAQAKYEEKIGRKVTKILLHLDKRRHVEVNDFVISMRSFQGGLERAWEPGCIRSSYIVLRPTTRLNVGYFAHLFKSVAYITALQMTANFIRDGQDLNYNNFCAVDLPFPPRTEQQEIANALDRETENTSLSIEQSRREIELVHEYRTRLIADVVTGKLDVREAAAVLPEDPGTPEAAEGDCAWTDDRDDDRTDRNRRTQIPAIQEEVTS